MTNKTYVPSAETQFLLATLERLDIQFTQIARLIGETNTRLQPDLQKIFEQRQSAIQEALAHRSAALFAGHGDATQFAINNGAKFVPVEPEQANHAESVPAWLMQRVLEFDADGNLSFHSDFPRLGTIADLEAAVRSEEGRMTTTGVYAAPNGHLTLASIYSHNNREHLVTVSWDANSGSISFEHQILLITEKSWIPDPTTQYLNRDALELQYMRTSAKYTAAAQASVELTALSGLAGDIQTWVDAGDGTEDRLSRFQSALNAGRDFSQLALDVTREPDGIKFIYPVAHLEYTPLGWRVAQYKIIEAALQCMIKSDAEDNADIHLPVGPDAEAV